VLLLGQQDSAVVRRHTQGTMESVEWIRELIYVFPEEVNDQLVTVNRIRALLTEAGDAAMKARYANDKDPTHIVWPDIGKMKDEYRRRLPEQEAEVPVLTMPDAVSHRVTVRAPAKLWVPFIRSVTPGGDTLPHG
jgi:hypothetical protein